MHKHHTVGRGKALLILTAPALLTAAALAAITPPPAAARVPAAQLRAEGTLLAAPKRGVEPAVARAVEPGLMSVVFSDQETAWDFYHESVANGEDVCLSDLGPQAPEHHGQRYWLRSC